MVAKEKKWLLLGVSLVLLAVIGMVALVIWATNTKPEKKETVYIPAQLTVYDETGEVVGSGNLDCSEDGLIQRVKIDTGGSQVTIGFTYHDNGKLAERIARDVSDTLTQTHTMTYDRQGNVLTEVSVQNGKEIYRYVYRYNENGDPVEKNQYYEGSLCRRITYTYDDQGLLLNERNVRIMADGREVQMSDKVYTYDDQGRKAQAVDGDTVWAYTYNAQGNLLREVAQKDGQVIQENKYTWNEAGKMLLTEFDRNGIVTKNIFEYDTSGNLTMREIYTGTKLYERQRFDYDDKGMLLQAYREESGASITLEIHYEEVSEGNVTAPEMVTLRAAMVSAAAQAIG